MSEGIMPMSVFVLYRVGGDEAADEDNCFTFQHPSDVAIQFAHVSSHSSTSPFLSSDRWLWRFYDNDGGQGKERTRGRERPDNEHWTEISNPGTVVPVKRLKGGNILVKARVVRVSTAIQVTKKAIREAVAQYHRSRRRMAENGGIQRREMVEQGNPSVERGSNEGSRYLGVIDTTQAINKKFGKAAQGLWKMMGNAAQMARNHLDMEEIIVGNYRVQKLELLAEGGFSQVYLVKDMASKKKLALKRMLCYDNATLEMAKKEVSVLKRINHENVIHLMDHSTKAKQNFRECMLLFPFYDQGTAWDAIVNTSKEGSKRWPFPEPFALKLFADTCNAVNALHSAGFVHRDIKPLNILLSGNGRGVLMDMGSAAPLVRDVKTWQDVYALQEEAELHCSAPYRSPELWHMNPGDVIDDRLDTWSLGCCLFALAFGHSPFETPVEGVQKLAIISGKFNFPKLSANKHGCIYSPNFCDLISTALQPGHVNRPRVSDLLDHMQRFQNTTR
eukprot:476879_1